MSKTCNNQKLLLKLFIWNCFGSDFGKTFNTKVVALGPSFPAYKMNKTRTSYEESGSRLLKVNGLTVKFFIYIVTLRILVPYFP